MAGGVLRVGGFGLGEAFWRDQMRKGGVKNLYLFVKKAQKRMFFCIYLSKRGIFLYFFVFFGTRHARLSARV